MIQIVIRLLCVLLLITLCSSACSKKRYPAALDALDSLRKIQAAIQVGANLQQYTQLLVEAKAKTNAANRALPDGELKSELNSIIDTYTDASKVWQRKAENEWLIQTNPQDNDLLVKYSIPLTPGGGAKRDAALWAMWDSADERIKRAEKLAGH